jgi:hypothetical protein
MIAVSECKCATNGTLADNNHIAFEVNRLHTSIGEGTKQIIAYAIKIGELLDIVKINLEKNDFEMWVKENISFATRTAYRYISLFNHKNQIAAAESLQEAYRQIETLEAQKRQTETQRAFNRVAEFRKTGVKPEGWRRGTDDKLAKEEQERDARIDQVKREALSREEKKQEQEQQREQQKVETENLLNFLDQNIQVEKNVPNLRKRYECPLTA